MVVSSSRKPPELGLVREGQSRADREGVEAAFRRYAPYVAATAFKLTGRREDVDDIVQDVFLAAMHGLSRLQHPEAIRTWLSTVTVRKTMKRLRRRRLRGWLGMDEYDYEQLPTGGASPEEKATLTSVYRALDRVPVRDRNIYLLRHVQGEELTRVATLVGCSLATVKRRLERVEDYLNDEAPHG